jgi:hypothetical protein
MSAPTLYTEDADETFARVTIEIERGQIADLVGFSRFDVSTPEVDIVDGKLLLSFDVTNIRPPESAYDARNEALTAAEPNPGLCGRQ